VRRRHVLIIVANLPVPFDRRVWSECGALRERGYDVSVVCPQGPQGGRFEVLNGVRIHRYRPAPAARGALGYFIEFAYSWLRTAWLVSRIAMRRRIDVIQACNPPDTFWALALIFKVLGVRFVFDQHDLCPEVYESRFESPSRVIRRMLRWLESASYKTADHVIVTNASYRRVALTRGRRDPRLVTIVRSGPKSTMRPVAPCPELRRGRDHLICYLGVMGPQDGVDRAVQAVDILVHELRRQDFHAAFLGFGDCLEELEELARSLQLDDWVSFPGRADDTMIAEYLSTATVGLCPDPKSPLNDVSTMNKTLEYMAFGLPMVSFDLQETRYSAAEASVYVADGDIQEFAVAIADLLDDPARCREMGSAGRRRIDMELAWEYQARAYVGVYDQLVGGPEP
jgi:glycosyltransferase involved in cell wall biosynthesis